jgi:penicillin-binding protein 1A
VKGIVKIVVTIFVVFGAFALVILGFSGLYFYNRLNRDLPKIERLSDYRPKAVTSILASDGSLIAEIWDERRYPVALEDMPDSVKNAFIAAEDASFYVHGGIDFISILRAVWVNLTSRSNKQGASTITQQIVKELLLSKEKTYERKMKEALLSYRLEKYLSKNEILSIYLNQIFLGSGAYGVSAASKVHFRKDLKDLSIAEAAFLGALPKKPSELTRRENLPQAMQRQKYVLKQMREKNFINEDAYQVAIKEEVKVYPPSEENLYQAPYFATQAIKESEAILQNINPEYSLRDPGGFVVRTTVDSRAQMIAEREVGKGLREIDKRHGWRGPVGNIRTADKVPVAWNELGEEETVKEGKVYRALVTEVNKAKNTVKLRLGKYRPEISLATATWAKTKAELEVGSPEVKRYPIVTINEIKPADVIEVSVKSGGDINSQPVFQLDQTPAVQSAMVAMSALSGEVKALVGGYDYHLSKFNRATQANLQPGSSFKPFIYLTAIQNLNYTASTLVPDEPISFNTPEGVWSPQNFDEKFLGPITLRSALQKSRNVVSVYMINKLGIDSVISTAKRLGITATIPRNLSIALGTPEVHVVEMVRSYAPFANNGFMPQVQYISSIEDRTLAKVFESKAQSESVIDAPSAFIMAHMMRGVVDRGTAQNVKALGRPVAGKTGTTNDHMDAWFIGYTPDWVCGVWVGFDVKRSLGKLETGGKAAAPIFLEFMKEFLGDGPVIDFLPPEGVIPVAVDVNSGIPVDPKSEGAFIEYFKVGTNAGHGSANSGENVSVPPKSFESGDYLTNSDF